MKHAYHPAAPAAQKHIVRTDIQGLRALAVVLVVLQHTWNQPIGGFIGVDIFFVISGYLISKIIIRDIETHGKLRLPRFYARRIRRIIPIALVVTLVTIALSWVTWYTPKALQYTLDGIWSTLWVANWHFAGAGTDYLAHSDSPSPFQHYWSLSVEEQFYIAWPVLLMLAWAIGKKRNPQRFLTLSIIVVLVASFAWALAMTAVKPTWAYFDTISRSFEFALGALAGRIAIKPQHGKTLGLIGLIGLIASAILILPSYPFPGPLALLPALFAFLIVVSPEQDPVSKATLSNPVSQWLGNISYSLYLWHFPVLIFAEAWFAPNSMQKTILIAIMLVLSHLSYHFVEEPLRHSNLLKSWETDTANKPDAFAVRRSAIVSTAVLATVGAMALWQLLPSKYGVLAPQTMNVVRAEAQTPFSNSQQATDATLNAITATTSWNDKKPSPHALTQSQMGYAMAPGSPCTAAFGDTKLGLCEWGSSDAERTILVLGDSVAMAWTSALTKDLASDTRVIAAGVGSCSIMSIKQEADFKAAQFSEKCATTRQAMFDLAAEIQPDVTVIASAAGGYNYQLDTNSKIITDEADKTSSWTAGTKETVTTLLASSGKIVVLGSPAITADPRTCITRFSTPADCVADVPDFQQKKETAEAQAVATLKQEGQPVERVDLLSLTSANGQAPLVIGDYITHTDTVHITNAYAEMFTQIIQQKIEE